MAWDPLKESGLTPQGNRTRFLTKKDIFLNKHESKKQK